MELTDIIPSTKDTLDYVRNPNNCDEFCKTKLENFASSSAENLLLVACEHESVPVVERIMRLKPEFLSGRNHDGFNAMHIAVKRGNDEIVRVVGERSRALCLEEDNHSMIPLQRAITEGRSKVTGTLVSLCLESLSKETSNRETVFHLALKENQLHIFLLLVEKAGKRKARKLMKSQDNNGNTVLHIAVSRKQHQIIGFLLSHDLKDSNGEPIINYENYKNFTALDLHRQVPFRNLKIDQMLVKAGAREGSHRSYRDTKWSILSMETRNVLLVVLVMIAGTAFTGSCNPPAVFFRENNVAGATLDIKDLLLVHKRLPVIFYFMLFNITGFSVSMGAIVVIIWSLPCSAVLLFVAALTSVVFVLVVDETLPKFFIIIGHFNISSPSFVWLSALALIFSGMLVWILVQSFRCIWYLLVKRVEKIAKSCTFRKVKARFSSSPLPHL